MERRKVRQRIIEEVRVYRQSVEAIEATATGAAKEWIMSHNMEISHDLELMVICPIDECHDKAVKYLESCSPHKVLEEVRACLISTGEMV